MTNGEITFVVLSPCRLQIASHHQRQVQEQVSYNNRGAVKFLSEKREPNESYGIT